jgi:hypothetical protein
LRDFLFTQNIDAFTAAVFELTHDCSFVDLVACSSFSE